jgi:hypothetical protein
MKGTVSTIVFTAKISNQENSAQIYQEITQSQTGVALFVNSDGLDYRTSE